RLFAIRAVAMLGEDTDNCDRGRHALIRAQQKTAVLGKLLVPGNSRQFEAKVNARLNSLVLFHAHRSEPDVIGVGQHANSAAPIKSDVEFAGQSIKVAMIENIVVQPLGQWAGVEKLAWINPGG